MSDGRVLGGDRKVSCIKIAQRRHWWGHKFAEAHSTVSEIVSQVDGARQKVNAKLSALVKAGKIEKVKRGVYRGSLEASLIGEAVRCA